MFPGFCRYDIPLNFEKMSLFKNKEKTKRLNLILSAFIFIMAAFQYMEQKEFVFAGIVLIMGLVMLLILRFDAYFEKYTDIISYVFNFLVASFTSYDFFIQRKHYIQYVWLLIGIIYLIFIIRFLLRRKKAHVV